MSPSMSEESEKSNRDELALDQLKSRFASNPRTPHPEAERLQWGWLRRKLREVFISSAFEVIMGLVILVNVVVFAVEVDANTQCLGPRGSCTPTFCDVANYVLLGIYTLEAVALLFVERAKFVRSRWNLLDAVIVVCGYGEIAITVLSPDQGSDIISYVRILRLGRILRAVRLFKPFPELHKLITGFVSTMKAIFWGFVMIIALLILWSILTVESVEPYRNKEGSDWCDDAFSSVLKTTLFFFQTLVAGDSWGACVIPLVTLRPELFLLFSLAFITVELGFTNLILAVIVDAAGQARGEDEAERLRKKHQEEEENLLKFYDLLKRMDTDRSGTISLDELMHAYDSDQEVSDRLMALGIDRADLMKLYGLMDDGQGAVGYAAYIDTIMKAEKTDDRMQFMMLKLQVTQIDTHLRSMAASLLALTASRGLPSPLSPSSQASPNQQMPAQKAKRSLPVATSSPSADQLKADIQVPKLVVVPSLAAEVTSATHALEEQLRSLRADLDGQLNALLAKAEEHAAALLDSSRTLEAKIVKARSYETGDSASAMSSNSASVLANQEGRAPEEASVHRPATLPIERGMLPRLPEEPNEQTEHTSGSDDEDMFCQAL